MGRLLRQLGKKEMLTVDEQLTKKQTIRVSSHVSHLLSQGGFLFLYIQFILKKGLTYTFFYDYFVNFFEMGGCIWL